MAFKLADVQYPHGLNGPGFQRCASATRDARGNWQATCHSAETSGCAWHRVYRPEHFADPEGIAKESARLHMCRTVH